MTPTTPAAHDRVQDLTLDDLAADGHATRYVKVLRAHPEAASSLLLIVSDHDAVHAMQAAEGLGHPALSGVVREVEAAPAIRPLLLAGVDGHHFRRAVGVVVKLAMRRAGWQPTGRKGPVRGAEFFRTAERYRPPTAEERRARARGARAAMTAVGTPEEQTRTLEMLWDGLSSTRRDDGRVL
jgi:hypothetical protein